MDTSLNPNPDQLPVTCPATIYMVAVAGTGMGALATVLTSAGHAVTGSDKAAWPPMGPMLEAANVTIKMPFGVENIPDNTPLAIVGNAVSRDHEEVKALQAANVPLISMPEMLHRYILPNRPVYVAAGTHGKTTTSAMLAHILREISPSDQQPGWLIGGLPNGWECSGNFGNPTAPFAIEGDEYSSVYWDHGPKFRHYRATGVVLPSLEYDHADVYPTEEAYLDTFAQWFENIPDATIVYDGRFKHATKMLRGRTNAFALGRRKEDALYVDVLSVEQGISRFRLTISPSSQQDAPAQSIEIALPMTGEHNINNAAAVAALLILDGYDATRVAAAFASFPGIAKRQTVLFESDNAAVVFDFGHHPTEIDATLDAVAQRWPGLPITAIFEPRSFSSRRNIHQAGFNTAFARATTVWLAPVFNADAIADEERLNTQQIIDTHGNGIAFTSHAELANAVETSSPNGIFLFFSNGDFESLPQTAADHWLSQT